MSLLGKNEETFPLAGGQPQSHVRQSVTGGGVTSETSLSDSKITCVVRYKDTLLECDVYAFPDEPLRVDFICPRCKNANRVDATRKAIQFIPHAPVAVGDFVNFGELSVEAFQCTWELPDAGKHVVGLRSGGISLCKLKIGISKNVARDA